LLSGTCGSRKSWRHEHVEMAADLMGARKHREQGRKEESGTAKSLKVTRQCPASWPRPYLPVSTNSQLSHWIINLPIDSPIEVRAVMIQSLPHWLHQLGTKPSTKAQFWGTLHIQPVTVWVPVLPQKLHVEIWSLGQ
jgi:hypothetical protein